MDIPEEVLAELRQLRDAIAHYRLLTVSLQRNFVGVVQNVLGETPTHHEVDLDAGVITKKGV